MFLHHKKISWEELTNSSRKKEVFSSDFYFELSYEATIQTLKTNIGLKLRDYTLLFIKPEAFIMNKIDILIHDLKKYHFELVFASVKSISHVQISELWKYMWPSASLIRILLNQVYYTKYKCGILILRNTSYTGQDLCTYLSDIKGATSRGAYKNPDIRYRMNSINTFLNHVHSPDEIADFMRETAVFCDWDELQMIYHKVLTGQTISFDVLKDLATEYSDSADSIAPELALDNLIQKTHNQILVSTQESRKIAVQKIYKELLEIQHNQAKFTHDLLERMRDANILVWDWPMFILVSTYMEYSTKYKSLI